MRASGDLDYSQGEELTKGAVGYHVTGDWTKHKTLEFHVPLGVEIYDSRNSSKRQNQRVDFSSSEHPTQKARRWGFIFCYTLHCLSKTHTHKTTKLKCLRKNKKDPLTVSGLVEKDVLCAIMTITVGVDCGSLCDILWFFYFWLSTI